MDTKSKKMKLNFKGIRGWFMLAVVSSAVTFGIETLNIDVDSFGGEILSYVAALFLILSCIMLAVTMQADSEEFHFFHLLENFKTDTLIVIEVLIMIGVGGMLAWLATIYSWRMWYGSGISVVQQLVILLLMLPETFVCVFCYAIFVRRMKDADKRKELWILSLLPKKKEQVEKEKIKREWLHQRLARWCKETAEAVQIRYQKAYSYEKKSLIRTGILVAGNGLSIFLLVFTDSKLLILLVLIADIVFYLREKEFYHNVGQIIEELHHISTGERILPVVIEETSPLYEAACDLNAVNESLDFSVKRQMKSEQMKVDLITNVSHDLKTPLTSIIGYIDLLKKEEMSPEAKDYVSVISSKSEHLKEMIQDLFEISKATSGNAELLMEKLDMVKLLEQTLGDMEDRINASGRIIKTGFNEEAIYISGDGRRLYRVYQNLIENALKYSMEGTRIYVDAGIENQKVVTTIKNIAAYEMDFTPDKIVERFQRGDVNRTTDGHGLGLAIAKSFSEACGGQLDIVIDGDLFKAIISYPVYREV